MGPVSKVKRMKKSISTKSNAVAKLKKKWEKPKKLISAQSGVLKIKNVKKRSFDPIKANRGVILLKNIPHGFYEEEMRKYFGQFGLVTRVRLARSERTARSKGYAYIEFKVPEVAQIAADTMNNYIMFKHVLKTAYIPPDKQTFNFFSKDVTFTTDANGVRSYASAKTKSIEKEIENINRVPTDEEQAKRVKRSEKTLQKQQKKYGIDLSSIVVSGTSTSSSDVEPTIQVEQKETKKKGKAAKKVAEKQPETNRKDNKIVAKKDKKKVVESDENSSGGKSLLGELLDKTYETDTDDDDFKIDQVFSASGDDSDDDSDDGNAQSLVDLLAKKLNDSRAMETSSDSDSEDDEDSVDDEDSEYEEPEIVVPKLKEKKKFNNGTASNGAVKGRVALKRKIKEFPEPTFSSSQSELDPLPKKKKQNKKKEIISTSEFSASEPEASKVTMKKKKGKFSRIQDISTTTATSTSEPEPVKPQIKQKKMQKVAQSTSTTSTTTSEPETVNKKLKKKRGKKVLNSSLTSETTASEVDIPKEISKKKKSNLVAEGNSAPKPVNVKGKKDKPSQNNVKNTVVASPEKPKQKIKNKKNQPAKLNATTTSSDPEVQIPKKKQKTVADEEFISLKSEPVPRDMKKKKPKPVTSSLIAVNGNAKKSKGSKIKGNLAKPTTTTTAGETSAAWSTVSETDGENVKGNSTLKTIVRKNNSKKKSAKILNVKKVNETPGDLLQVVSSKVIKQNQLKSKKKAK